MKNSLFFGTLFFVFLFGGSEISAQNNTNISPEIKKLIAKKRDFNKSYGYGHRIQIYYGNETKARSILNKFKLEFPEVYCNLKYEKPDWKVKVGNYKTKLEADRAITIFSEKFPNLIVVPLGK